MVSPIVGVLLLLTVCRLQLSSSLAFSVHRSSAVSSSSSLQNKKVLHDNELRIGGSDRYDPLGPPNAIRSLRLESESLRGTTSSRNKESCTVERPYFDPSFKDLSKPQLRSYEVSRIARNSGVFLLKGFLTEWECDAIMHEAKHNTDGGMKAAKSRDDARGEARTNCRVSWLGDQRLGGICGMIGEAATGAFLTDEAKESLHAKRSDMQVLHYEEQGSFVLHHDGQARILTVICYLNGVGETWLPLVDVEGAGPSAGAGLSSEMKSDQTSEPFTCLEDAVSNVAEQRMRPSQDGLLVSGKKGNGEDLDRLTSVYGGSGGTSRNVVGVDAGDAVAFYSYSNNIIDSGDDNNAVAADADGTRDFNTIHAGLPVQSVDGGSSEKWIATCWYHAPEAI